MHRQAKFIWKSDQKIDHTSYFNLVSTAPLRREGGRNQWVLFRKTITLPSVPKSAIINITCDGRYQLFVNGRFAARGPSRASPHFMRYDHIELDQQLVAGDNIIAVLVHSPGVDLAWYETTKGAWQPVFGDGGLYVELSANCQNETIEMNSDASWKYQTAKAWNQQAPRTGWGQDFIEDFDANNHPDHWQSVDYDDQNWPNAQCMISHGSDGEIATGRGSYEPFPCLIRREIPQLAEHLVAPAEVVWTQSILPRPELSLDQQLYQEQTAPAKTGMFENINGILSPSADPTLVTTQDGTDAAILLAFDPYITGCPFIEIEAKGGEIIEVAAGESLPGEFDGTDPKAGLKRPNYLTFAHLFRYTAKPGKQRFEKFEFTAIRGLQITIRNAPKGLKIHHVGVNVINYPARFDGAFSCNDESLTELWEVGRHTALQCMHDAFEDCPGREKRQWLGDGVVHLDIAGAAFGPSAYPLGRQFLRHAAESQRCDGLLQMYSPGDHRGDGVFIPDFSLHWVMGLQTHWMITADEQLIEELFPAVEKVLAWFCRHMDHNDLLANIPFWHFIEWANIGRSGESAPINALFAGALNAAAQLAKVIDSNKAAQRFGNLHQRVKQALNNRHWSQKRKAYVDEVDPKTGDQGKRISQQTNALMIALDLAPNSRIDRIIETISDQQALKFTAAPPIFMQAPKFDENIHVVRANTLYCHFLYAAFAKAGRFDLAIAHMREIYQPMLATGTTTLWESFEPSASLCHVFSATPVYQLCRHSLGIIATAPGFAEVKVAPQFADLTQASGTYPTSLGDIHVRWQRKSGTVNYLLEGPENIHFEPQVPTGFSIEQQSHTMENKRQTLKITFSRQN